MPAKYSEEVRLAIWGALCDGQQPAEITRNLKAGNLGIDPFPQANYHTVVAWKERLIKERGQPKEWVAPGTEVQAASTLTRAILSRLKEEWKKLEAKEDLTLNDVKMIAQISKLILDTQRSIKEIEREEKKDPERADAGQKGGRAPKKGILEEIARRERARRPAAGVDDEPAPHTNGESPEPHTPDPSEAERSAQEHQAGATSGPGWPE